MNDFFNAICKTHQHGDLEMLQVQKFSDGWLCMFAITTNGRGAKAVEHRVAYMCRTPNGAVFSIWDNIA